MRVSAVRTRVLSWLALSLMLSAGPVFAQAGTASLTGTVTDDQGAVLPGVTVTISNASNGFIRTTATAGDGTYQLLALPPGTYALKVELQSFRTVVYENVPLPVDTTARQDVKMAIGGITDAVEVTAETKTMNTTDASLGNVISGNQVRALPLEARNVVGLLSL